MNMAYYHDPRMMNEDHVTASILAVGDSWFWYPSLGGSLVNYLGPLVDKKSHNILVVGNNGAEIADFTVGKYCKSYREVMRLYGKGLSAVFISAGGNDFAGLKDLTPLLNLDCANAKNAKDCFRKGKGGLNDFLDTINNHYRNLIGQIWTRSLPNCQIVLHTYDYALPSGRGFAGIGSAWIKPALDAAKVPPKLQQACVNHIIDALAGVFQGIVKTDPTHFHLVDSRGVLSANEWANELHPTAGGFKKIATTAWRPVLQQIGLA
jgi:hypothetical protein